MVGWIHFQRAHSRLICTLEHGPLARYVKLRVAHAPGMPGTFSPPPRVSDTDMHHGTSVTHMPWCMPGSITSDFLWSRWLGKRSRHSRRMRIPQFYQSGKRSIHSKKLMWSRSRVSLNGGCFNIYGTSMDTRKEKDGLLTILSSLCEPLYPKRWFYIATGPSG